MELILKIFDAFWIGIKIVINNPTFLIIIILSILMEFLYPKFRGYMGEFWVKLELKKLSKKEYIILNDIMLRDRNGTHQIDHLVISKYGIFVIEMKNYYGLITGNEYKDNWCQHLGKKKYFFKNPISPSPMPSAKGSIIFQKVFKLLLIKFQLIFFKKLFIVSISIGSPLPNVHLPIGAKNSL